jgi:transcription-repair coupling factor (superfamily II helicase)
MTTTPTTPEISLAMDRLLRLGAEWTHGADLQVAMKRMASGEGVTFDNVIGSARSLLAASLLQAAPSQVVIVTPQAREIDEIFDELELFSSESRERFLPWESSAGERDLADEIYSERLRVLQALAAENRSPRLLVTSIQSWQQPVTPRSTLMTQNRVIRVGEFLPVESVERFSGEVGRVRDELDRVAGNRDAIIVAQTEAETERLFELFASGETARQGRLRFAVGNLVRGFGLPTENQLLLGGNDLFQRTIVKREAHRQVQGKALDSFLDLRVGDLVVHLSHGIGRYLGLELLDRSGQAEEHLTVEFDAGVKVYVPASRIHLVQKYVGGARGRPKLAKLGGKSWVRHKQAAQAAVRDVAADMLELQASRTGRPGIAFATDSDWQREFDAAFPYQETPDQLRAIAAIKQDMELARPMDRLLCGDVGFGKTELAMRAAFKAVESGYQVALLVPTTVLVEQHFRNFSERMAEFPLQIAKLSRFGTAAEQKQVVRSLASGGVDIVIGTHRLASKDIRFDNLGLVVIDEEQRFGVDVKERLKTLRSSVDVLTMTATPIPRTLHMSLVGVRDISNLETPPKERVAVETKVTRWTNEVIRHAVLRELNRGGQIYFVHNRVQDIHVVATKLRQIVPEVRIGIAHGQLPEDELECVMVDFLNHEIDLLLATTIVESGLDIPNANTIFIDEADCYGLADLHQLRGRVGRSSHRAYCHLLLDPRKGITPQAAKRLHAIEEFSEMGAGFAISMRDLEIRGAGNLLGNEQSGHIAAVGYELYCQLLEDAVRQQRPASLG